MDIEIVVIASIQLSIRGLLLYMQSALPPGRDLLLTTVERSDDSLVVEYGIKKKSLMPHFASQALSVPLRPP